MRREKELKKKTKTILRFFSGRREPPLLSNSRFSRFRLKRDGLTDGRTNGRTNKASYRVSATKKKENSRTFAIIFAARSCLVQITSPILRCLLLRDFDAIFCHSSHSKQRASKNKADNIFAYTKLEKTKSSSK